MKLSLESLKNRDAWRGYRLPGYDPAEISRNTRENPVWLHFGPGNIFRAFPAVLCQRLIDNGLTDRGIICCEGYDPEVISKCYDPFDNLSVAVTLRSDGTMDKEVVGSCAEALTIPRDYERVSEVICSPSLQIISFTITEKGYSLRDASHSLLPDVAGDMESGPGNCESFMGRLASMLLRRYSACRAPIALVSMDNCSRNGEKLRDAVMEIAGAWLRNGRITEDEYGYLQNEVSFPWTMIDKITPRPDPAVTAALEADGLEGMEPFVTSRNTYTAAFVNAEAPQYLVVEDLFPNGRPPLEEAGVIFTDRETVDKAERMKVSACLNPLHTCLALFGCLLGYASISAEMSDPQLPVFIERMSREECLPFADDPGVLDPEKFLDEVLRERLPNPFMPDTPQRIAVDTSQKIPIRFGVTIKAWIKSPDRDVRDLKYIPLTLAGYLRYLMGVDDNGNEMACSPDPMLDYLQGKLSGVSLGAPFDAQTLRPVLSDVALFGVDLCECGLAEKVAGYLKELAAGPGAVRAALEKYTR